MSSIQATRLKKGNLVKMGNDLFRVLELQHVTPGNLRGFVRVKFRNIRNGTLSDQKLRSEDTVERATLDGADRFTADDVEALLAQVGTLTHALEAATPLAIAIPESICWMAVAATSGYASNCTSVRVSRSRSSGTTNAESK